MVSVSNLVALLDSWMKTLASHDKNKGSASLKNTIASLSLMIVDVARYVEA